MIVSRCLASYRLGSWLRISCLLKILITAVGEKFGDFEISMCVPVAILGLILLSDCPDIASQVHQSQLRRKKVQHWLHNLSWIFLVVKAGCVGAAVPLRIHVIFHRP